MGVSAWTQAPVVEFAEMVRAQQLSGDESLEVAKAMKSEPEMPIGQAIVQVKERRAQDRQTRKAKRPRAPGSDAALAAIDDSGPEVIRYLVEQPADAEHLVETRDLASLPLDPLLALRAVPSLIAAYDLSGADLPQVQALLEEIVAAAQDMLAKVGGFRP